MKKKLDLDKRLARFVTHIKDGLGENPLVFLDTGAIIDFEREVRSWKLIDSQLTPSDFYNGICGKGFPIYVNSFYP